MSQALDPQELERRLEKLGATLDHLRGYL